jgi:heat shock protein HslJ
MLIVPNILLQKADDTQTLLHRPLLFEQVTMTSLLCEESLVTPEMLFTIQLNEQRSIRK